MAVTSSDFVANPGASRTGRLGLAVVDANWFSTENLFSSIARDDVATLLLTCIDYRNAWQRGLPPWAWRSRLVGDGLNRWRRGHVLPSGWMKRFPSIGMRPIARTVRNWRESHVPDGDLALVMTYPYYLHLRDKLKPARTVYYNIDDYSLYWPARSASVQAIEREAVRASDLTVCVSRLRAEELRLAVPEASARIHHLPHGAPSWSIPEVPWERPAPPPADIAHLPRPLIGYIGSIEDRVDWALLTRIAREYPQASLVVVGRIPKLAAMREPWTRDCERLFAMPNVHALGWRPQTEIGRYNQAFDAILIPYDSGHPFNRVCSPTKIMDSLGTGRPIVATGIPECHLYDQLFHVANDADAYLHALGTILAEGSDDGRAWARHDWARGHTCQKVADRLVELVQG